MTTDRAIAGLDELMRAITSRVSGMQSETEEIAEQWAQLGRIGGQRDDHAALLLARLRPHLRDLGAFCANVEKQIDGMVADPFGRKGESAKSA